MVLEEAERIEGETDKPGHRMEGGFKDCHILATSRIKLNDSCVGDRLFE